MEEDEGTYLNDIEDRRRYCLELALELGQVVGGIGSLNAYSITIDAERFEKYLAKKVEEEDASD